MGRFALFTKKECYRTTWLGKLSGLLIFSGIMFFITVQIHPFLEQHKTVDTDLLVVEGFITDYAIEQSAKIFEEGNYSHMLITGKIRLKGSHLDQYENDGLFSAATLAAMGFDMNNVTVVAVDHKVNKDRTYASAVAIKEYVHNNYPQDQTFDLITLGTHARRSRILFEKAFDNQIEIGIIPITDVGYNPDRWWQSSNGFREVSKETIAWVYARFFFFPGN